MGHSNKAIMEKDVSPGMHVTSLTHGACRELFITAELGPSETADNMFRRVQEYIDEQDA